VKRTCYADENWFADGIGLRTGVWFFASPTDALGVVPAHHRSPHVLTNV
jgi:hypothetical protein